MKQKLDFNHPSKSQYFISKIFFDNDTIVNYAKELSYDLSFFEYKNNVERFLPDINSDLNVIKKTFNFYKDSPRKVAVLASGSLIITI